MVVLLLLLAVHRRSIATVFVIGIVVIKTRCNGHRHNIYDAAVGTMRADGAAILMLLLAVMMMLIRGGRGGHAAAALLGRAVEQHCSLNVLIQCAQRGVDGRVTRGHTV